MLPAHYSLNSTRVQENYAKERRASDYGSIEFYAFCVYNG